MDNTSNPHIIPKAHSNNALRLIETLSFAGYRRMENLVDRRVTGDKVRYSDSVPMAVGMSVWFSASTTRPMDGMEPAADKYPSYSPYIYNNLVNGIDPDGRSDILKIKRKKVIVVSKFYFYGDVSRKEVRRMKKEIKQQWNSANGTITVDGQSKKVIFRIRARKVTKKRAARMAANNKSAKKNFIKIEKGGAGKRSFMQLNGNAGIWYKSDNLGRSTTTAHEVGHGWGYYNPLGADDGVHSLYDLRGTGRSDIMGARGTLVDPQFRYQDWKTSGYEGINPNLRKANQHDIDGIFRNITIKSRVSSLGSTTNTIY